MQLYLRFNLKLYAFQREKFVLQIRHKELLPTNTISLTTQGETEDSFLNLTIELCGLPVKTQTDRHVLDFKQTNKQTCYVCALRTDIHSSLATCLLQHVQIHRPRVSYSTLKYTGQNPNLLVNRTYFLTPQTISGTK